MRLTKKKETQSRHCFPLVFWRKCVQCGRKFGLERGCKIGQTYPGLGVHCLCGECSSGGDKEKSDLIFKDMRDQAHAKRMMNRPPPPRGGSGFGVGGRKNTYNDDNYITIKKI